ncbi:Glycerol-3-phosphate dehydrogenase (NAD(P)+) [Liberibacter crescens BT-1]|uniref:Glycerol-3-phosphate dehydrogenase [NAD(P)+] n=1 Tax=Liberibacter crescens (strain BT-1) TaxID=1215343 RepID=L0EV65_LIBCB|nr:NAD(P)H-dependent glycerol-3-phosphate dehydrogenase [Liberibacter crescens]AGA64745.1 Glycerol-3-phosphate dehydrogenase (NAD(P)+) [Liberibacter crescens BT-1]AMC12827.1 glycerol-3-phosphate dehydrogenase [Liberibacter crescens]
MKHHPFVCVIGAGAFGTALASVISSSGNASVVLLGRQKELILQLTKTRIHQKSLPGIVLSDSLGFSTDHEILQKADIVLFAMPSKDYSHAVDCYGPWIRNTADIIVCAKGFDHESGLLLSDILEKRLPSHSVSVLSGPGFASDIARELPVGMVLASENMEKSRSLCRLLSYSCFNLYPSDDRTGVQLAGALKNIIAIACGLIEGACLGESARALVISHGLAEISRLVRAAGGCPDTVHGLSGLGDLVLTATSHQSRNLRFGISLGKGFCPERNSGLLVEGVYAASLALKMAARFNIKMFMTEIISSLVEGSLSVDEALKALTTKIVSRE